MQVRMWPGHEVRLAQQRLHPAKDSSVSDAGSRSRGVPFVGRSLGHTSSRGRARHHDALDLFRAGLDGTNAAAHALACPAHQAKGPEGTTNI